MFGRLESFTYLCIEIKKIILITTIPVRLGSVKTMGGNNESNRNSSMVFGKDDGQ